ncbi:MAG: tetratricopeptide repeat protein [Nitrosopumilaceae archaeon]|nr:tetratricopeptide repeat protein [Nitrosopumilaceae archaeon]
MNSDPRINSLLDQANQLFLKKKFSEAISFYEEILQSDSENVAALNNLGYALSKSGQYEKALSYYNKAIRNNSDDVALLVNIVSCLRKQKEYDKALNFCDQVLEKNPNYNVILYHKERILSSCGKYDDSNHCCDQILRDYPNNWEVLYDKAKNHANLKNSEECIKILQFAMSINPNLKIKVQNEKSFQKLFGAELTKIIPS